MAKDKIEDIIGEKESEDVLTATPDGEKGEGNPLEKMDKISKAKPDKKDSGDKSLDEDVLTEMLKTGENTGGMLTPDKEEELEDEDEKAKVKVGKKVEPSEKYAKEFKNDMLKHPDQYKIQTPEGEMTVAEAFRRGYNPITKQFDDTKSQKGIKEKYMSQLNDADRAGIEQLTDPSAAQVAPADAEMFGLPQGSPMIRPDQAAMMGGAQGPQGPQGTQPALHTGGSPVGGALPGSEESMAPGGADLSALLGGQQ